MADSGYGTCHNCLTHLQAHYWSLDRNIEQVTYDTSGGEVVATINVKESQGISVACSAACADDMVADAMAARGYKYLHPGDGPVEPCAKCGKPVDLTSPHVTYALTSGTEISKPWLTTFEVDDGQAVAILCAKCESPVTCTSNTFDVPLEEDATMAYCCDEDASSLANS